ncbi:40S ribosomal protein S2 [Cricetulus griseus]|uniref:Small ribosomal subunit protein uS5 n=1 Tax=Cricetulus griseus TaxID=10029 RepID=G3I4P8_CRIGR|nr:40S ribosomal protein S2 [Cricetulus griseus]
MLILVVSAPSKIGKPHTVPYKVTLLVHLIPAPRGTGIVSALVPKKLLMMAGGEDCYTSARGYTATLGNCAKATFDAISKTYSYLTPGSDTFTPMHKKNQIS